MWLTSHMDEYGGLPQEFIRSRIITFMCREFFSHSAEMHDRSSGLQIIFSTASISNFTGQYSRWEQNEIYWRMCYGSLTGLLHQLKSTTYRTAYERELKNMGRRLVPGVSERDGHD